MARSQTSVKMPAFEAARALRERFVRDGTRQSQAGSRQPTLASNDGEMPSMPTPKKQSKPRPVMRSLNRR